MKLPPCGFCKRRHRPAMRCADVRGCWCFHGKTHIVHPRSEKYMICVEQDCPCVYKSAKGA